MFIVSSLTSGCNLYTIFLTHLSEQTWGGVTQKLGRWADKKPNFSFPSLDDRAFLSEYSAGLELSHGKQAKNTSKTSFFGPTWWVKVAAYWLRKKWPQIQNRTVPVFGHSLTSILLTDKPTPNIKILNEKKKKQTKQTHSSKNLPCCRFSSGNHFCWILIGIAPNLPKLKKKIVVKCEN